MVDKIVHLDLDDEQISILVTEISKKLVATRQERTSWERRIQLVLGIATAIGLVFSLGINWSRIANAETKISDAAKERREISDRLAKVEMAVISQQGSYNLITQQLLSIQSDLQEIKVRVYK